MISFPMAIACRPLKKSFRHYRFDDIILTAVNRPERQIIFGTTPDPQKIPDRNRDWGNKNGRKSETFHSD